MAQQERIQRQVQTQPAEGQDDEQVHPEIRQDVQSTWWPERYED